MYCKICGSKISEDNTFCPKCGTKIEEKNLEKTAFDFSFEAFKENIKSELDSASFESNFEAESNPDVHSYIENKRETKMSGETNKSKELDLGIDDTFLKTNDWSKDLSNLKRKTDNDEEKKSIVKSEPEVVKENVDLDETIEKQTKKNKKSKLILIIAAVLLVIALIIILYYYLVFIKTMPK